MTTKPETIFGRDIMKNIDAQWTRIENRHGGGVPDLYGIKDGISIWLELLYCPRYEIKGSQTVQRGQRPRVKGSGLQMSLFLGT